MNTARLLSSLFLLGILGFSTGCTTVGGNLKIPLEDKATVQFSLLEQELIDVPEPIRKPSVAVYRFNDQTGQKRQNASGGTSFSTAVTQAPDVYLIRALKRAAGGKFFQVIDRSILDDLTKERQLIRQTRQSYNGEGAKKLPALTFAGMLVTGGIVGYDSSVATGGLGARYLGLGVQQQYRVDTVTIVMRLVSVSTNICWYDNYRWYCRI